MKTRKQINTELAVMHEMFPSNETELHRQTPFQLLMSVILSAQTTDKQVNKVTSTLYQIIKSPQDILDLGLNNLTTSINSLGFFRSKASYIFKTCEILVAQSLHKPILHSHKEKEYFKQYGYVIFKSTKDLSNLSGVGIKTAKVVSHALYGGGEIGVDTHVHRVSNRLGWLETKLPEQTSKILEHLIFDKNKSIAHHSILLFGRYQCTAKKPKCESCPLQQVCRYYEIIKGNLKSAKNKD